MAYKLHPNVVKESLNVLFRKSDHSTVNINNEKEVIECIERAFKKWHSENLLLKFEDWQEYQVNYLKVLEESTRSVFDKKRVKIYIHMMEEFRKRLTQVNEKSSQEKFSTVNERLYALSELCPDLIKSLRNLSKKEQKELMQIITNSNGDNILKKLIYNTSPLDVDSEFIDLIDSYKLKISKKVV